MGVVVVIVLSQLRYSLWEDDVLSPLSLIKIFVARAHFVSLGADNDEEEEEEDKVAQ